MKILYGAGRIANWYKAKLTKITFCLAFSIVILMLIDPFLILGYADRVELWWHLQETHLSMLWGHLSTQNSKNSI